ncbi:RimK family alpha-L-glutamate ligase [Halalkalibaculum sp. DA3122]|uniref:ATP-grasp domain-containing protein n=1 Tax=unclassified Halalkalibaculum TaxID=2964617 RepID=UPI003754043E
MKIAIHQKQDDFSSKWIEYCEEHDINYKIVNCYSTDIIEQVEDCDALMWHFNQARAEDVLFAKQLIFALQTAGKKVFPDFYTGWHFDDKVGQKYLLEAIGAPAVPSYVFYNKQEALNWVENTTFPKVFKLRRGAGSAHVKLVNNRSEAARLVHRAFSRGFSQYDKVANLKDRWYKFRKGKTSWWDVTKGILRLARTTEFARIIGPEKGYVYFQDFIPGNDYDIRVIVIDGKAFAIKRLVREGDFRASGSGHVLFEKKHFDEETIRLSQEVAEKVQSQCLAIDYVYDKENRPFIVELSYGFVKEVYYNCEGYWDRQLNWHQGRFDAQGWMVESLVKNAG